MWLKYQIPEIDLQMIFVIICAYIFGTSLTVPSTTLKCFFPRPVLHRRVDHAALGCVAGTGIEVLPVAPRRKDLIP